MTFKVNYTFPIIKAIGGRSYGFYLLQPEGGYSNARGGRGGNRGGGYSRRYSYDSDDKAEKVEMLRSMMNEVSSEDERRALQKVIRRMEND